MVHKKFVFVDKIVGPKNNTHSNKYQFAEVKLNEKHVFSQSKFPVEGKGQVAFQYII